MDELHPLEKKVLVALGGLTKAEVKELERECSLAEVEVMRAVQWLQSKNLISVSMRAIEIVELLDNQFNFPERELLGNLAQEIRIQLETRKKINEEVRRSQEITKEELNKRLEKQEKIRH